MVSLFRNLSLNAKGDDVGLLQNSLSQMGNIIDSKEKTKKIFGKSTEKAVRKFQSENGLKVTGKVDILTANKIEKIAKSVVTEGEHGKSDKAAENNNIIKKTKLKKFMQVPRSLLESELFFKSLEDSNGSKLNKEEEIYINQKLNAYFQNELLLRLIGNKTSDTLSKQLKTHISKLNYTKYIHMTLLQAINEVLTYVENIDSGLKQDIAKIKESLASVASSSPPPLSLSSSSSISTPFSKTSDQKIETLLDLNTPLKDNHIFRDELKTEKTRQYISLTGLNSSVENRVLEAKLDFYHYSPDIVFDLIQSKVISEKQAHSLKNIASMARLTGDNPKFVKLLAKKNIKSVACLISWKSEDWEEFIIKNEIPLPSNVTSTKTYAENIRFNIERSYPTQILLTTISDSSKIILSAKSNLIDSVNMLLETNDKLIESGDMAVTNWKQIKGFQKAKIKEDLHQLISFSNFYKHLGIQDIINNKKMSIVKKKAAIKTTINHISTFNNNNPELDLRLLNFFDNDEMQKLDWSSIPAADKPRIRKQMMAYQRVLTLSDQPSEHTLLMTKGFDSATSIGRLTQDQFETTCGLELGRARMVYYNAQHQQVRNVHNFEAIRNVTRGEFQHIRFSNQNPKLVNALRDIDGFDELFGSQNYCSCQECMSILSPAAYFVDLMRFIHENISKKVFLLEPPDMPLPDHPLYLKNRRSDLWNMKISCENTHTLIPYLNIVNEVLQAYLERVIPGIGGATGRGIFEILSENSQDTKVSFSLPFNRPIEEIQLYLSHFGILISDIYRIFSNNTPDDEIKIWRSKLGLSKDQFNVIANPDRENVKFRYGDHPSLFSSFPVPDFLKSTGLTRDQLDELLQIKFNNDLANIVIEKIAQDPDELLNFKEVLKNLDKERLDFIHRFIQLLKRTKWSIPELDMVLEGLDNMDIIKNAKIESSTVIIVSKLVHIQETLKLNVEELRCMVERLPVSASYPNPPPREKDKKLFERIFDIKALFNDPITPNSFEFHHFAFNTKQKDDTGVDPKMPLLLSGLGITEAELVLLFRLLNKEIEFDPNNGKCRLDRLKISLLYRHVRLARGLKFASINDFVTALSVQSEPDLVIDNNTENKQRSINRILQIIDFRDWLIDSPFDVNELALILFGQENSSTRFSTTKETVIAMLHEIQNSKEKEEDKTEALKDAISALFGISLKHLEKILLWVKTDIESPEIQKILKTPTDPDSSPIPSDGLEKLIELIHEIERVLLIFSELKFTEKTVVKITDNTLHFGIGNLKNLTLENLQSLTIYYKILDSMIEEEKKRDSDQNIGKLLEDYRVDPKHQLSKENIDFLSTIWKNNGDTLDSISKSIVFPSDSNSTPIDKVYYLWKLSEICKTLGINGSLLVKIRDDAGFKELSEARDIILGIFSSKYEDEKVRQEKLGPYQDKINKRETDILSDYIICLNKELRFKNYNDLYSFFLLDPEMGSCARTSRLASAISSLQLYVHRCLVNLEQSDPVLSPTIPKVHVDPSIIPQDQWAWRKNLVLWRGNREIFLYPENYLEPDLRDNKTPLFKELEEELLQQKITKDSVEASYRKYVSQFAELARLVISGAYYHSETKTYYLFGRTAEDPWQYYYRECIDNKIWKPWKKVDATINSNRISAVIYRGRFYIFWHDKSSTSTATVSGGDIKPTQTHTKYLVFSSIDEYGKWSPPQKFAFEPFPGSVTEDLDDLNSMIYPYVKKENTKEDIYALSFSSNMNKTFVYKIDLFKNNLIAMPRASEAGFVLIPRETKLIGISGYFNASQPIPVPVSWLGIDTGMNLASLQRTEPRIAFMMTHDSGGPENTKLTNVLVEPTSTLYHFDPEIQLVGSKPGDSIIKLRGQQYLIIYDPEFDPGPSPVNPSGPSLKTSQLFFDTFQTHSNLQHNNSGGGIVNGEGFGTRSSTNNSFMNTSSLSLYSKPFVIVGSGNSLVTGLLSESRRTMTRISTSLHDRLGEILFTEGIEKFLSLETQKMHEQSLDIFFLNRSELSPPVDNTSHIDFEGAYGEYYRELFLHIPFLVAHSLNANQKFREAKWWYERIFDPTSSESPTTSDLETDRNWRYIEFRGLEIEKMRSIFTEAAILQYEIDPFNPHAIARLRTSAYQKAIVMKYIDNLLDWGDHLFAQDTTESINEALMLYTLAFDILGERPVKMGSCESAMEESKNLTYQTVEDKAKDESDFLITLENWDHINHLRNHIAKNGNDEEKLLNNRIKNFRDSLQIDYYDRNSNILESSKFSTQKWTDLSLKNNNIAGASGFTDNNVLLFCIPQNEYLLKYWDRVEDRLFKIRNCMNISGVRRSLALFQPPINPMLLVKAKASGLALEDILSSLTAPPPLYRFTFLIEKAKQFAQTVQNFGSALLGALEKKDTEELILLRSVHERNILNLTKEVKKKQLEDAIAQHQAMVESRTNVENRINYYKGLIEGGLISWERIQQISRHTSSILQGAAGLQKLLAGIFYLIPQLGSPFAMKFGGKEFGDSATAFSAAVEGAARIAESISASAGLEASFQRREQEWKHQLVLAEREFESIDKQVTAYDIRRIIAEKEIEIHDKNIEQTNELDEFYKNKFTNLGLYNYLSTSMFRLYREAYTLAFNMAKKAEKAYQFEVEDVDNITEFIAQNNWQFDRAGLLAGERLILQLQSLENAFVENNGRQNEITQSFSLALLAPGALTLLKEKAECEFKIPEIMFDLVYPGQYRRTIKSVRITMPCVTGPYTNIGIKLTLTKSKIRYDTKSTAILNDSNNNAVKSISTSSAQNDTGMFEFAFRDERYLPFEGAGAVESEWKLELPFALRSFDYNTISDVILHISYTSKEDGAYRERVQAEIVHELQKLSSETGLFRLISLKHDFPAAFNKLLNPGDGQNQITEFVLSKNYFPYFLAKQEIDLRAVTIYLKPKGKEPIQTSNPTLTLKIFIGSDDANGTTFDGWTLLEGTNLKEKSKPLPGNPIKKWTMDAGKDGFKKDDLDDIIILMDYKTK